MKRLLKRLLKITAIGLLLLLIFAWLGFWSVLGWVMERQSASAEIRLTHVGGNIYLIDAELRGRQLGASLAASVGPDGVLLVDAPMTDSLAAKVRLALDELGAGEVRYVINTHPHPDHTRSNAFFAATATVLAHDRTRLRLASATRPFSWLPAVPPLPPEALPSETFDSSRSLRFNGEEVRLLHLGPGHTDGDVVVHFTGSNVVHLGDLFNGPGGHSVSDTRNAGGDVEGLLRSVAELTRLLPSDVRILCGHGGLALVASRTDLETYHEMLSQVVTQVQRGIAAGRNLEEVAAEGIPPRWAPWFESARDDSVMHGDADGWLRNLYRGLVAQ